MKRTSFLRLAALLLACLALLAVALFGRERIDQAAPPATSAAVRHSAPDTSPERGAPAVDIPPDSPIANAGRARAQRTQSQALQQPAPGTQVLAVVDALDARARAGDDLAACRLAVELLNCDPMRAVSDTQFDTARTRILSSSKSEEEKIEELDRLDEIVVRTAERARSCEGVDRPLIRRAPHYALMGARSGNPTATSIFLSGEQVTPGLLVVDPGLAAAYRQHGWPMLRGLIESGHPAGAFLWESALWTGSFSPMTELVPADWQRRDVARALQRRIGEAMRLSYSGGESAPLDPLAVAEAELLFQRHFAHSPWLMQSAAEGETPIAPLAYLDRQRQYEQQLGHCDPARPL